MTIDGTALQVERWRGVGRLHAWPDRVWTLTHHSTRDQSFRYSRGIQSRGACPNRGLSPLVLPYPSPAELAGDWGAPGAGCQLARVGRPIWWPMIDADEYAPLEPDDFPGVLREIALVAGVDAARSVARAKGGTLASIPQAKNLTAEHWLSQTVGIDAARKIAKHLLSARSVGCLEIPRGPDTPYQRERRRIENVLLRAFFSTATIDEAARAAGVDRSSVKRHWRRLRKDGFRRPERPDVAGVANDT